jgi:hypothetical protein
MFVIDYNEGSFSSRASPQWMVYMCVAIAMARCAAGTASNVLCCTAPAGTSIVQTSLDTYLSRRSIYAAGVLVTPAAECHSRQYSSDAPGKFSTPRPRICATSTNLLLLVFLLLVIFQSAWHPQSPILEAGTRTPVMLPAVLSQVPRSILRMICKALANALEFRLPALSLSESTRLKTNSFAPSPCWPRSPSARDHSDDSTVPFLFLWYGNGRCSNIAPEGQTWLVVTQRQRQDGAESGAEAATASHIGSACCTHVSNTAKTSASTASSETAASITSALSSSSVVSVPSWFRSNSL